MYVHIMCPTKLQLQLKVMFGKTIWANFLLLLKGDEANTEASQPLLHCAGANAVLVIVSDRCCILSQGWDSSTQPFCHEWQFPTSCTTRLAEDTGRGSLNIYGITE